MELIQKILNEEPYFKNIFAIIFASRRVTFLIRYLFSRAIIKCPGFGNLKLFTVLFTNGYWMI